MSHVEIFLPHPLLQDIEFVDTPGLNSTFSTHENFTQVFSHKADAFIWVFSAGQVGKASEIQVVEKLLAAGRPLIGVLNRADEVDSEELSELITEIQRQFPNLPIVPISAKKAFLSLRTKSAALLQESGFSQFLHLLESSYLDNPRSVKSLSHQRKLADFQKLAEKEQTGQRQKSFAFSESLDAFRTEFSSQISYFRSIELREILVHITETLFQERRQATQVIPDLLGETANSSETGMELEKAFREKCAALLARQVQEKFQQWNQKMYALGNQADHLISSPSFFRQNSRLQLLLQSFFPEIRSLTTQWANQTGLSFSCPVARPGTPDPIRASIQELTIILSPVTDEYSRLLLDHLFFLEEEAWNSYYQQQFSGFSPLLELLTGLA
jgi:hypothetical protein